MPSTLPHGLEAILRKCLEKDRNARYANAAELAMALAPFGSEDARVSLGRVAGMFHSSGSIKMLTRSVSQDVAACTSTLEVPVESRQNPDDRRTSDIGAIASAPPASSSRWLIVGVVGITIAGVFVLRGPLTVSPRPQANRAAVPPPLAAPPSVTTPKPVVAEIRPLETALPVASAVPAAEPTRRVPMIKKGAAPLRSASVSPAATTLPAPAASMRRDLSEPTVPAEPVTPPEPSANAGSGRSAEIERLIEQRH